MSFCADHVLQCSARTRRDLSVPRGVVWLSLFAAVFSIDGSRAKFVAVAGTPLVEDRRLVKSNAGLRDRVQKSADALRDWLRDGGELAPPPPAGVR